MSTQRPTESLPSHSICMVQRCTNTSETRHFPPTSTYITKVAVPSSFDESYHLLALKNNGGLVIPSRGTVKVLTAAERLIRRAPTKQAPKLSTVTHIVREEIGTEDVFLLGEHIEETQFGIDNIIPTCCHWLCLCFLR